MRNTSFKFLLLFSYILLIINFLLYYNLVNVEAEQHCLAHNSLKFCQELIKITSI
jgi:hypothetical protein